MGGLGDDLGSKSRLSCAKFFSSHSPSPLSHVFVLQSFFYLLLLSCQYNENAYTEHPIYSSNEGIMTSKNSTPIELAKVIFVASLGIFVVVQSRKKILNN